METCSNEIKNVLRYIFEDIIDTKTKEKSAVENRHARKKIESEKFLWREESSVFENQFDGNNGDVTTPRLYRYSVSSSIVVIS